MTRRHAIAVAVGLIAVLVAALPPLWVRATGDEVALALAPVDPLSLFRGNYVDLAYDIDMAPPPTVAPGGGVFVVVDGSRPATVLRITHRRPTLDTDEHCLRGRATGNQVTLPELEQFFVTPEQGAELEQQLSDMVGIVKTTRSCRSQLVRLEPE